MVKMNLPVIYIKQKGVFDLSEILQGIKKFFEDDSFKVHFPKHKYKVPSPKGGEHELRIYGERKMNEYIKFTINLFIRVFDWKEIEVVKDCKKIKTNYGRLAIDISGVLELDYENRFGGSKFMQGLQDFYHKYIIYILYKFHLIIP